MTATPTTLLRTPSLRELVADRDAVALSLVSPSALERARAHERLFDALTSADRLDLERNVTSAGFFATLLSPDLRLRLLSQENRSVYWRHALEWVTRTPPRVSLTRLPPANLRVPLSDPLPPANLRVPLVALLPPADTRAPLA